MFQNKLLGFILFELMAVIVIIGILYAIGLPLYMNYIKDAQITEVKNYISQIRTAEDKYYQLNNNYFISSDINVIQNNLGIDIDKKIEDNWQFNISVHGSDPIYLDIQASGIAGTDYENLQVNFSTETGTFTLIE